MSQRDIRRPISWMWVIVVGMFTITGSALSAAGKSTSAQAAAPRVYTVQPGAPEIRIDGVADEPAWQAAGAVIPIEYEWWPGDNTPAKVSGECRIVYNKTTLYALFICRDPRPQEIRAHLMDRDNAVDFAVEDYVGLWLDTFNDRRRAYVFRVNPLGVQCDSVYSEVDGKEDYAWDAIWSTAGRITPEGYTVEIAIPFAQLRFSASTGKQAWGISCERSYPRYQKQRLDSRRHDRNVNCQICQFDTLDGLTGITPGHNIELDPAFTLTQTDKRRKAITDPMESGKVKVDTGLTARWGITPNLTLNATINPDFSNVEADVAQLDINTRFALLYPEKRPFFLENADLFKTPLQIVFTRTVADPRWGLRLNGKFGRNAFGLFLARDNITNILVPFSQYSISSFLSAHSTNGVLRFRRDLWRNSTVGVLVTGRHSGDYRNINIGADLFWRWGKKDTLTLQYMHSSTKYPLEFANALRQPTSSFAGDAVYAEWQHADRKWVYGLNLRSLSPDYRADSGFISQTDVRRAYGQVYRLFWGKGGWLNLFSIGARGDISQDFEQNLLARSLVFTLECQGPMQSDLYTLTTIKRDIYLGIPFDLAYQEIGFLLKPSRSARFRIRMVTGDQVDILNYKKSHGFTPEVSLDLNFNRRFYLGVSESIETLSRAGNKVYTAHLLQSKLVYNFTIRTYFRAILQYRSINRNLEMFEVPALEKERSLFVQLLFAYKLNPRTVAFLGYSDQGERPNLPGVDHLWRKARTVFLKIGYALSI